jgi:hypothetical protein
MYITSTTRDRGGLLQATNQKWNNIHQTEAKFFIDFPLQMKQHPTDGREGFLPATYQKSNDNIRQEHRLLQTSHNK